MGYDIAYHAIDVNLITRDLLPFFIGDKPDIDEIVHKMSRVSRNRDIAFNFKSAFFDLIKAQKKSSLAKKVSYNPWLHMYGRPFFILENDIENVCNVVKSYVDAKSDTEVLAILKSQVDKIDSNLFNEIMERISEYPYMQQVDDLSVNIKFWGDYIEYLQRVFRALVNNTTFEYSDDEHSVLLFDVPEVYKQIYLTLKENQVIYEDRKKIHEITQIALAKLGKSSNKNAISFDIPTDSVENINGESLNNNNILEIDDIDIAALCGFIIETSLDNLFEKKPSDFQVQYLIALNKVWRDKYLVNWLNKKTTATIKINLTNFFTKGTFYDRYDDIVDIMRETIRDTIKKRNGDLNFNNFNKFFEQLTKELVEELGLKSVLDLEFYVNPWALSMVLGGKLEHPFDVESYKPKAVMTEHDPKERLSNPFDIIRFIEPLYPSWTDRGLVCPSQLIVETGLEYPDYVLNPISLLGELATLYNIESTGILPENYSLGMLLPSHNVKDFIDFMQKHKRRFLKYLQAQDMPKKDALRTLQKIEEALSFCLKNGLSFIESTDIIVPLAGNFN